MAAPHFMNPSNDDLAGKSIGDADRVLDCIDKGLDTFGESVKQAIYWRLEAEYRLKRRDIVERPDVFSKNLFKIFGVGTKTVEHVIIEKLRATFDTPNIMVQDLAGMIALVKMRLYER